MNMTAENTTMVLVKRGEERELVEDRFVVRNEFEPEKHIRKIVQDFLATEEGKVELEQRKGVFHWSDAMNAIPLYFWNLQGIVPVIHDGFNFAGETLEIEVKNTENLAG